MQGFYLYRNDRLIDYGEWQSGLFGENVDPHHSLAKMAMIFAKIFNMVWIGSNKTNVDLPIEFLRKIKIKVDEKEFGAQLKMVQKCRSIQHFFIVTIMKEKRRKPPQNNQQ